MNRNIAQIACEACINRPEDYDYVTLDEVLEAALIAGVGDVYTNALMSILATMADD